MTSFFLFFFFYTYSLTQCSPSPGEPSQVRDLFVCSLHAHTHILGYPKRGAGDTHTYSLTQCSPSPGEQSQVRDLFVCSLHTHTHTYSGTPRGVPGIHTHTHSLNVVCSLVSPRGVPGEGLSARPILLLAGSWGWGISSSERENWSSSIN